jgi:hypothetical protein
VAATLPNQQPLVLMLSPSWGEADLPDQIYVALSDGRWQGNAVHPQGAEECDLSEPDDAFYILALVADAAQETIVELLWQAWPVCPYHRIGMHPRPEGTTAYWDREWGGNGPVVWWCRGNHSGDCHDVSQVGALAAALPGKQRRALRRRERKRDRPR